MQHLRHILVVRINFEETYNKQMWKQPAKKKKKKKRRKNHMRLWTTYLQRLLT